MLCLGIIMFGDLIALLESVCFLLYLEQHHYGNPIGVYGKKCKHMQHKCSSVPVLFIFMCMYIFMQFSSFC